MKKKNNSSFYRGLRTRKKMKTKLTKKDNSSIIIKILFKDTNVHRKQINKTTFFKSIVIPEVVKWLIDIVGVLLLVHIGEIY